MRRGRLLILVGLILACGTAAIVYLLLQRVSSQPATEQVVREEVVVATQPVAEDEVVDGRLELVAVPKETIPEGALRTLDGTTGMIARGPIPQGTIVQMAMLQTPQEQMAEGTAGQLIEPGFLAVAFPITELSSVSYGIQPGDRVDVLLSLNFIDVDLETQNKETICPPLCPSAGGTETPATLTGQLPRMITQLTLQNIYVMGVGRWAYQPVVEEGQQTGGDTEAGAAAEPPQFITLMLQPQDALVLKFAREKGASIDLALRQKDDGQVFPTEQVTLDYLMAHYGISLPDRKDYTIEKLVP